MIYGYVSDFKPEKGYVYFISDGLGHVKIGIAKDVQKRLYSLQTCNPLLLEIRLVLSVKDMDDARRIEQKLHTIFNESRLRGEWFDERPVEDFLDQDEFELCGYVFKKG